MKILNKRAFALLIDTFIFGSFLVMCQAVFQEYFLRFGNLVDAILLIPFFMKDFVFRNASIGKKIMGIAIYDDHWEMPKFTILIKRTFLMLTVGHLLFWKAKLADGDLMTLFDWERDALKTQVIDKRVLKKLQEKAKESNGEDDENMTELYNGYLRSIYMK